MAFSTLTIKLTDNSNVTVTLVTSSFPEAQAYTQNVVNEGFWDNSNIFHPASAVVSVTVS